MTVTIATAAVSAIRADVAAAGQHEACGLLLGQGLHIATARPCRNVAADPSCRFEIDPAALLAAHRATRQGGQAVLGHYHSHPNGSPSPSPRDAADAADDGALWLIVGAGEMLLWRAVVDGMVEGRFDPVTCSSTACAMPSRVPTGLRDAVARSRSVWEQETPSMTVSPVDLASLMCSRLCHDLLSPVGALNNGLELLADETDPAMRERVMELLAESARTSASKLKFFRLAFGAAGGFGDQVDVREACAAIDALVAEGKGKTLVWLVDAPTLPKAAVKVLLNLALLGNEALVRGGTLSIGAEENGGQVEIVVQGEGPRVLLDAEIERTLTDGEGDAAVTARTAAAYMVHTLVAERGGSVQVSRPNDGIMILGATLHAQ